MTLSFLTGEGRVRNIVVADSITKKPLVGASVFDCDGILIGISNHGGRLPRFYSEAYPLTYRYLGFKEKIVLSSDIDTVFLSENHTRLPEVIIESGKHKILHILAYVREYSTLSTYTDTVSLFREKMVDFMLPGNKDVKFRGWTNPRILKCKSYYRFTDSEGLDSVSDKCNYHFSWSDWIGVGKLPEIPLKLKNIEYGNDTLQGKYSPAEIWSRNNDRLTVNLDILADTITRGWIPDISVFFRNDLEFENFRIRFNYANVISDSISNSDLTGYSFNIESKGRGHGMFMFNNINDPLFVTTYAEVYMIDKEFITVKEARKWEKREFNSDMIEIIEPFDAPDLQLSIKQLISRVNSLDRDKIRLSLSPDHRLMGRSVLRQNVGQRALQLLKNLTGITRYRMNRNINRQWNEFTSERIRENEMEQGIKK